ncbi:Cytochrome P450 71D11 [Dichanthelium oligosanthes]|uniref:Cytochrome P450 71D11 n=1 Tax=Dichanthelium oligosanthes TaxID=888268 RepID=A0A1E5VXK5_9POAL|nr:Cytochrome P450 71D11 [Dichanthelium oligosanthes]
MLLRFGALPVVVASSAAAAREVTKTHDLAFATLPISPTTRLALAEGSEGLINAPYGDAWRQLRKVCTLELLSARISSYVADATARAIIGSRFKDRARFFRLMEEGLELFSKPSLPDLYPSSRLAMLVSRRPRQMKRLHAGMLAFMDTIIQEHQLQKGDGKEEDLVDVLLRIQRDDGDLQILISLENIKSVVSDLFVAGSETSATALQWAMCELMRNPRVMHKAQDEVRRVLEGRDRGIEECVRPRPVERGARKRAFCKCERSVILDGRAFCIYDGSVYFRRAGKMGM